MPFQVTARNIARVLGLPDYPFLSVQHPIGSCTLPELKARFEKSGGEAWDLPDDKLDAFVASEYDNWTKLIREAGIKLD